MSSPLPKCKECLGRGFFIIDGFREDCEVCGGSGIDDDPVRDPEDVAETRPNDPS